MFNTSTNQPSTQNSLQGLQAFRMHRTVLKPPSTSHILDCIDPSPLLLIPVIIFSGWWFHSSAHHDQTGLNIMTAIKRTLWIQQLVLVDGWPTPLINISQMGVLFLYSMEKNVPNHQPGYCFCPQLSQFSRCFSSHLYEELEWFPGIQKWHSTTLLDICWLRS